METAEKRKISANRQTINTDNFIGWWTAIVIATGVLLAVVFMFNFFAAFGISEVFNTFGGEDLYLWNLISWIVVFIFSVMGVLLLLTFAQRWLIRRYWHTAFQTRDILFVLAALIILIAFDMIFYLMSGKNAVYRVGSDWVNIMIVSLSILQLFTQWRWLRQYVQNAWLFLLVQGSGIAVTCYWWFVNSSTADFASIFASFVTYLITLLITGLVVYRLFTQHNAGKLKRTSEV